MATGIGENNSRWRLARASFFAQRAFLSSRFRKVADNPCLPSDRVAIDVPQDFMCFSTDGASRLTRLVKDKSLEEVGQLGGIEGLVSSLETNVNDGIHGDTQDVSRRSEIFGANTYGELDTKSFFHFVWKACKDPSVIILLVCAAITLGVGIWEYGIEDGGWYDGGSMLIAVFFSVSATATSNCWQTRRIKKLFKAISKTKVDVVRNGKQQRILISEIVVGDVVSLKTGDQVPANGLYLEGCSLQVNESCLTCDSEHVEVNHNKNPFLFSGTEVTSGYAKMLVTSVGKSTTWGEMMMSMVDGESSEETPLQAKLDKLASAIAMVSLVTTFFVFVVLLVQFFRGKTEDENGVIEFDKSDPNAKGIILGVVRIISNAVTIADVAIPEDLSMATKFTLAYSLKKMMEHKARIRNKSACETMGFATTICVHKTATLTLNQMEVTELQIGQTLIQGKNHTSLAPSILELLYAGLGLNIKCGVDKSADSGSSFEFSRSPTEEAILQWAVQELQMDMELVKQNYTILHMEASNSEKKRSGVLIKKNVDNTIHANWKGAPEVILAMCSNYYDPDGNTQALDNHARKMFDEIVQGLADRNLQCVAFAHKQFETESGNGIMHQLPKDGLTFLGLVGLKNPCRPGVSEAIKDCQVAGVNVIMVTGDNAFTAKAIAQECGILEEGAGDGAVVEGGEFRDFTEEERLSKVDTIRVMARSSPSDKRLMAQCLKKKGHIVTMIGDGKDDMPALKEAHVGISMGNQCTEMTKMSSDILILHDDFASVATVLEWGRCVYTNVQKFIQFQLTVAVASLAINVVTAFSVHEVPFTTVQLLWISIIMETLAPLALASDKVPAKELMEKPPITPTDPLITNYMWRNLLAQAIYQIIVILTLQFKTHDVPYTVMFNTFVFCQVFNFVNARKLEKKNVFEKIHRNKRFLGIIAITVTLQVVMVEVGFLNWYADTEKLGLGEWGECIGFAIGSWLIDWLVKFIPVPEKHISSYFPWTASICNSPIFRPLRRRIRSFAEFLSDSAENILV